jgi:hypothetical protein
MIMHDSISSWASRRPVYHALARTPRGEERAVIMLTKKYTFRPAWLLFVGSGLLLAMLLTAGVILSAHRGTISATAALYLHLIPNLVLAAFCVCWLAKGHIVLKPNQVVLQGWAEVKPESGRARRAYVRRHVPRSEWHTLHVSGLLLGTVTWTDGQGTTIVLRHLSQAVLLKQLLHPRRQDWAYSSLTQQLYAHRARGLGLLRAFALLRILLHTGVTLVQRLYPEAAPGWVHAEQRCLRRARRLFCWLRERPYRVARPRVLRVEDFVRPGYERAWFARLLKEIETSTMAWGLPTHVRMPMFVRKAH